jgi:hypothetical protein
MAFLRGGVALTPSPQHWRCPACGREAVTQPGEAHARLHPCPRAGGLLTPYAPVDAQDKARGKVTVHLREDYANTTDTLRWTDDGKPAMRVSLEHDGGMIHNIFVPGVNVRMGPR